MALSGLQQKQIQKSFLSAFGDEATLRQMLKLQLDVNLEAIAQPGPLAQRIFDLIGWADTQGRTADLVEAALLYNPRNSELIALAADTPRWHISAAAPSDSSPYKGLAFFDSTDAHLFFGREALTAELVTYVRDHRFLAVVGASGCGKSSVVRAGIIPAIHVGSILKGSDRWATLVVTPSPRPLESLAVDLQLAGENETDIARFTTALRVNPNSLHLRIRRLLKSSGQSFMLLIIDQFEELFTLCRDRNEQQAYIDNILGAAVPDGVTSVIVTLRADFYARCAEFANLRLVLQDFQKYIGPMSHDELRSAIEKPAAIYDWDFEAGLVDVILDDVEGESGALPLLSHALLETWKRRSGRVLTLAGYRAAGGVQGAIAKTADAVYSGLPAEQQAIVRNIFLRLTTFGEGIQDTRRRAPLLELLNSGSRAAEVQLVLKRLEDERLVTADRITSSSIVSGVSRHSIMDGAISVTDDALTSRTEAPDSSSSGLQDAIYVDVTHEALISKWPRLLAWLNQDRENLLVLRRLTDSAQEWDTARRDPTFLFRGVRLTQAVDAARIHASYLNDLERGFLNASQAAVATEQHRRRRFRMTTTVGSLVIVVVIAMIVYFAASLYQRADAAETAAEAAKEAKELGIRNHITELIELGQKASLSGEHLSAARSFGEVLQQTRFPDIPVYIWIEGGSFTFGSTDAELDFAVNLCERTQRPSDPTTCARQSIRNEQPTVPVTLEGFWIQSTEVTNGQYKKCVDANVCTLPTLPNTSTLPNPDWDKPDNASKPVTYVSWDQASTYAAWAGARLPTEAEWEFACRGTEGRMYPWDGAPPATPSAPTADRANLFPLTGLNTVGLLEPGANKLYDMAGNAREWTSSVSLDHPGAGRDDSLSGVYRAVRGGTAGSSFNDVRCTVRRGNSSDEIGPDLGFRVISLTNIPPPAEQ